MIRPQLLADSGYANAGSAPQWPFAEPETRAPVTEAVKDDLNRFLASVERRALRIAEFATGGRDEALDIVQDAMLQLATHYAHRPSPEWAPLFHRILDNKVLDWQRRQSVRRRLFGWSAPNDDDGEALAAIPDRAAPEAAEKLKQAQAMTVLRGALARLPRRQQQAFVLRIWEGLSVEDTARAMGCSDGSVKTHLSRALHSLRGQLDGVWP